MLREIIQGDCLEILPEILKRYPKNQIAVITDPPYGGDYDTDYTRFSGGVAEKNQFDPIEGDSEPFNPMPWLEFEYVTLWGYQHFAQHLPLGSILVWNKRRDVKAGKFLSDGELGWEKGGKGVYCFNFVWDGFDRQSERGKTLHPTQKPVALFEWCIRRQKLPKGTIILDPYAGSGPCLEAAHNLGFDWIGVEKKSDYVQVSNGRIDRILRQPRLFDLAV